MMGYGFCNDEQAKRVLELLGIVNNGVYESSEKKQLCNCDCHCAKKTEKQEATEEEIPEKLIRCEITREYEIEGEYFDEYDDDDSEEMEETVMCTVRELIGQLLNLPLDELIHVRHKNGTNEYLSAISQIKIETYGDRKYYVIY